MNKKELVDSVAIKLNYIPKRTITTCLEFFIGALEECLVKGEKITIKGFGTIQTKPYVARIRVNPQTLSKLSIPAGKKIKLSPSKQLLAKIQ